MPNDELTCDVFCNIYVPKDDLAQVLASGLGGDMQGSCDFLVDSISVDVRKNKRWADADDPPEAQFLNYPYEIEITAPPDCELEEFKSLVRDILLMLWKSGIKAVAACDFEDELPIQEEYLTIDDTPE